MIESHDAAQTVVARPRVLLIVGLGRSGSTLFERVLGEVRGVTPLGEIVHLWERGLRNDELCGCRKPFSACSFWEAVGNRAFGGWDQVDADDAVATRYEVVRTRHLLALLKFTARTTWKSKHNRFLQYSRALYEAASAEAGRDILVDSSKMPAYAALLTRAKVDLRCVEVIRDPRGVAYSWTKSVVRPEVTREATDMPRLGSATTAMWWLVFDWLFRLIGSQGVPVMSIRYEDFVANPRASVISVLKFAGHRPDDQDLDHIQDDHVILQSRHMVAGNPMRFETGEIGLKHDVEWRESLPGKDRRIVSALTICMRRRYGYR